jgi:putative transposase
MKKSRFTDSQIMAGFKRVEAGLPVPELCRDMGISTVTFYKRRAKYGGMDTSMMSRMKELKEENRRSRSCMWRPNSKPTSWPRHSQESGEAVSQTRDGQTCG